MAAMFQDKYIFSQLIAFLNRTQFNNYVRKYDGNRYVKYFTYRNQMLMEKPLYFDPFGQIEFAPVVHNIIAPCKVLVQGSILFYPFRDSGFS